MRGMQNTRSWRNVNKLFSKVCRFEDCNIYVYCSEKGVMMT